MEISLFLFKPPAPTAPYGMTFDGTNRVFPGRWTDGQNWVDYFPSVAHHFSPVTAFYPDPVNGTNLAVAGSTSAQLLESQPGGLPAQIPDYLRSKPGMRVSSEDLYVIWIGANDFVAGIFPADSISRKLFVLESQFASRA